MRLPLEALVAAALLAAPSHAAPAADPAAVRETLGRLGGALSPLARGAYQRPQRAPVLAILSELRERIEAVEPAAAGYARADAVRRLRSAAVEAEVAERKFWAAAGATASVLPASTADRLRQDAAALNALFDEAFPSAAVRSAPGLSAPAAFVPPPAAAAARRAAAEGRAAAADPGLFFDGGSRGAPATAFGGGKSGGGAVTTVQPARRTDLRGAVPAPAASPVSACREASGAAASLCAGNGGAAYLAPVAMGLLDAVKRQFGTVAGVVSTLAMLAVGVLMSALSGGTGLILNLLRALLGAAALWMLASMIRRLIAAIGVFRSTPSSDPRHWLAAREFGRLGGELILAVLLTVAGVKIGQSPPVKNAVGSMAAALEGQMARLGLRKAAPPPSMESLFGEAPDPGGPSGRSASLRPPGPPPAASAAPAAGRSLSDPASLRGATGEEVASLIPKDWASRPMRTGRGMIYERPGTRGADIIQISRGNPAAPDALHQGPYVKIVTAGKTTRVDLQR